MDSGRGNRINATAYIVINDSDRREVPELAQYFGIAVERLASTSGKVQYWLFQSESQFDDEVLAALSQRPFQHGRDSDATQEGRASKNCNDTHHRLRPLQA
jgi:hypothetical protein